MVIKVIPINVTNIDDLIRLVANVRRERSALISYPYEDGYHIGFYLPPQIKSIHGVFVYTMVTNLENVYAYSPNDGGSEVIRNEYIESPMYVNIFVSRLKSSPHVFVGGNELDVETTNIYVEDIKSFIVTAYTTTLENVIMPFSWWDRSVNELILNIEVPSEDEEDNLLLFRYKLDSHPKTSFLEFNPSTDEVRYVDAPIDISKKYMLIVEVDGFPY